MRRPHVPEAVADAQAERAAVDAAQTVAQGDAPR
jgi:hypothetical protein